LTSLPLGCGFVVRHNRAAVRRDDAFPAAAALKAHGMRGK
jgi:hypothetical protein